MRPDSDIRADVDAELRARSRCDGVVTAAVHEGVVKLEGFTCSYCEKQLIGAAVRQIEGVCGVVDEIEVHLTSSAQPTDAQLHCEVMRALRTEVPAVAGAIHASVHHGEVSLTGTVEYRFLKARAESAIRRLVGVTVVHNAITLDPRVLEREVEEAVSDLVTGEHVDVRVRVRDGEVTLTGQVPTDSGRHLAARAAWSVPEISSVRNEVVVKGP